jgi:hypothetical protein
MLAPVGVTAIDFRTGAVTVSVAWPLTPLIEAVMVDEPMATPVASPAALIDAAVVDADTQLTWLVRFCVELSEKVPVAVNGCVVPFGMLALDGVTAIDCKVTLGLVTVRVAWPLTPLIEAVITEEPAPTPVASPLPLMVATAVLADTQLTWLVRFCIEPSEYVPVAVNCCVDPLVMLGVGGATTID